MIWRRVAAGALVLGLVVALVVVLWPEAEVPVEPTRPIARGSSEPASETPSPSAEPSPSPTLAVPTPDTTGRDFDRIFREINEFRNWLFENPQPDSLRLIFHQKCDCFAPTFEALDELARRGYRFSDDGTRVVDVVVTQEFDPVVRLTVTLQRTRQVIIDTGGSEVRTVEAGDPTTFSTSLVKGPDGRWVVRTMAAE